MSTSLHFEVEFKLLKDKKVVKIVNWKRNENLILW